MNNIQSSFALKGVGWQFHDFQLSYLLLNFDAEHITCIMVINLCYELTIAYCQPSFLTQNQVGPSIPCWNTNSLLHCLLCSDIRRSHHTLTFHKAKLLHRDVDSDLEIHENCSRLFEIQINKQDSLLRRQCCADMSAIFNAFVWEVFRDLQSFSNGIKLFKIW